MWDYAMFIHAVDALTIAVRDCKTFFPILVGENSTVLLKRNFYSAYTVSGNSSVTFTKWSFHGVNRGWEIHPWL